MADLVALLKPADVVEEISISDIQVLDRLRAPAPEAVEMIATSMAEMGLRSSIEIRFRRDGETGANYVLLTGNTRLQAARQLGWSKIAARVVMSPDQDADRLIEITENLHRSDLTALERGDHVALYAEIMARGISRQVGSKPGRPKSGLTETAKALKISKSAATRAKRIGGLTDEAKDAARALGLDDNESVLAAASHQPAEEQAEAIRAAAAERSSPRAARGRGLGNRERWVQSGLRWWKRGADDWQRQFLGSVDAAFAPANGKKHEVGEDTLPPVCLKGDDAATDLAKEMGPRRPIDPKAEAGTKMVARILEFARTRKGRWFTLQEIQKKYPSVALHDLGKLVTAAALEVDGNRFARAAGHRPGARVK